MLPLLPDRVTLCNAAGLHDTSTAELAVALALASGRHLDWFARDQVPGTWDQRPGRSLADQRVLIVGYGHIGAAIEARLQGFEVASVTRVSRRGRTGPPPVHPFGDLPALLPVADVVFVTAPHTPQTEGLFGARNLGLLPDGALLVNVARGKLVDTAALLAELVGRADHRRAGRDRPRAAARRPPAVARPRRADLAARRRRELRLRAAGRPADRRAAGRFAAGPAAGEHRPPRPSPAAVTVF